MSVASIHHARRKRRNKCRGRGINSNNNPSTTEPTRTYLQNPPGLDPVQARGAIKRGGGQLQRIARERKGGDTLGVGRVELPQALAAAELPDLQRVRRFE
jgi:hypothetical protein